MDGFLINFPTILLSHLNFYTMAVPADFTILDISGKFVMVENGLYTSLSNKN